MPGTSRRRTVSWIAGVLAVAAGVALVATHRTDVPDPRGVAAPTGDTGDAGATEGTSTTAATGTTTVTDATDATDVTDATGTTGGSHATGTTDGTVATGEKGSVAGLVDRKGPPPERYRSVVRSFVLNVGWATIEPRPGEYVFGPIDDGLATARDLGMTVRLRVFAGIHAPEWAKSLGGAPFEWYAGPPARSIGTIPRFWTAPFGDAYARLQRALAQRYDARPELVDVVVSRCTTEFAEPFIRQAGVIERNRAALEDSGYTATADERCLLDQLDAHLVWRNTPQSLAFNPYQRIDERTWTIDPDADFSEAVMRRCRSVLGTRCVLANNSLTAARETKGRSEQIYEAMERLGAPITFQTATPEKVCGEQSVGDDCPWRETLDQAVARGAQAVELPRSYTSWSIEDGPGGPGLATYARRLAAGRPG